MRRAKYAALLVPTAMLLVGCAKTSGDAPAVANACGAPQTAILALGAGGGARDDDTGRLAANLTPGQTAEIIRQLSWQLCNARDKGWIDDEYFRHELIILREQAFAAAGGRKVAPAPEDKPAAAPET